MVNLRIHEQLGETLFYTGKKNFFLKGWDVALTTKVLASMSNIVAKRLPQKNWGHKSAKDFITYTADFSYLQHF